MTEQSMIGHENEQRAIGHVPAQAVDVALVKQMQEAFARDENNNVQPERTQSVPAAAPTAAAEHTHRKKRARTSGENLFDLTTYGGLALIGNEVAATAIVKNAEGYLNSAALNKPLSELQGADKLRGMLAKSYRWMGERTAIGDHYFAPQNVAGKPQPNRFTYIAFAIIGGFLMVPFIKALEENKGKLVRFADRMIHGKKAETDPNMLQAHKEMDEAPKQSWGSLMNGRLTTVAAAYAVDTTINWENGLLARATRGKFGLQNGLSIEAASNKGAELLNKGIDHLMPGGQSANRLDWLQKGGGLLSFSAVLTLIFYVSSKLFAAKREHRNEHRQEISRDRVLAESSPAQEKKPARPRNPVLGQLDATDERSGPTTMVSTIEPQDRVQTTALQEGLSA